MFLWFQTRVYEDHIVALFSSESTKNTYTHTKRRRKRRRLKQQQQQQQFNNNNNVCRREFVNDDDDDDDIVVEFRRISGKRSCAKIPILDEKYYWEKQCKRRRPSWSAKDHRHERGEFYSHWFFCFCLAFVSLFSLLGWKTGPFFFFVFFWIHRVVGGWDERYRRQNG